MPLEANVVAASEGINAEHTNDAVHYTRVELVSQRIRNDRPIGLLKLKIGLKISHSCHRNELIPR